MSQHALGRSAQALLLATVLLGLTACSLQPSQSSSTASVPSSKPHPHFAPPPQGHSHWDAQLGVHVLENAPALYYRERTYYHWNNGWSWAVQPAGPWQACPSSAVPPGLSRHYGQ
jgi:hypothetical protein